MPKNVPVSVWRPTSGLVDYDNGGVNNIVDSIGDYLVDPIGDYVVDTGVVANLIPTTEWEEDDSL